MTDEDDNARSARVQRVLSDVEQKRDEINTWLDGGGGVFFAVIAIVLVVTFLFFGFVVH